MDARDFRGLSDRPLTSLGWGDLTMYKKNVRLEGVLLAAACALSVGSGAAVAASNANKSAGRAAAPTVTKSQSHSIRPIDIWAVVNSDGTLARGERVVSAFRTPVGVPG